MLTYQTLTAGYFPKHTGWFYFSYVFLPPLLLILGQDEKLSELLLDLRYRVNTWCFRTCQTSVLCRSLRHTTTCEMFCSCHVFSVSGCRRGLQTQTAPCRHRSSCRRDRCGDSAHAAPAPVALCQGRALGSDDTSTTARNRNERRDGGALQAVTKYRADYI